MTSTNDITLECEGRSYSLHNFTATVLDVQWRSETIVTTRTSGGGLAYAGTPYISAPVTTVSSHTNNWQTVFVRTSGGQELSYDLSANYAVRTGNTLMLSELSDGNKAALVRIRNFDTGATQSFDMLRHFLPKRSWAKGFFLLLGTFCAMFLPPALLMESNGSQSMLPVALSLLILCAGILLFIKGFISKTLSRRRVRHALKARFAL